jgi:hypothetical protein
LAWARKKAAYAADIGIAGFFIVGIALLVIDPDRFTAHLAGMMMFPAWITTQSTPNRELWQASFAF